MPRTIVPTGRGPRARAELALLLLLQAGAGCGVVEDAAARVRGWWGDEAEAEPAAPPEAAADPSAEPSPDLGPSGGSTGPHAARGGDSGSGGTSGGTDGDDGSGSTTLPMSYARPPTTGADEGGTGDDGSRGSHRGTADEGGTGDDHGTGSDDGGEAAGTTGGSMHASSSCLEGTWSVDDDGEYYRDLVKRQAHGRPARRLSRGGRFTMSFDRGELRVRATHRRSSFSTTLADNEIDYDIDVHGEVDADYRMEGADTLVVDPPRRTTLRASEVVRFPGGKTENRRVSAPTEGRFEMTCGPAVLELRPIEDGKPGPLIRMKRPAP
ncbi:MAG: hypothetical protein H6712_11560 [Myxococcales bacterium]|nr:hypothetical protein [Myxococcales bacterium]MCB9714490.1 hypothetical protein [Myxococcales bacterium]